jgi:hypothetical protein
MSNSVAFTVDTSTPAPTITTPSTAYVKTPTPSIAGTAGTAAGDPATVNVTIYNGAGTGGTVKQGPTSATVSSGAWSLTPGSLGDGTYTAQVTQTDAAGHTGSSTDTFTVDTVAPAPTIAALGTWVTTSNVGFSGTAGNAAGDSSTVTVQILGAAPQTLTPTRSGTGWSVSATLPDGAYTARVTQTDTATNSDTSSTIAFNVDTSIPAPAITSPSTTYVNSATPSVTGTAGTATGDAGTVSVTIFNGAGTGGTIKQGPTSATVSSGGWSLTPASLSDGTYTAQVKQTDAAGHTGTSAAVTFTVDTAAPPAPVVSGPTTWATSRTPVISGTAASATGDNTSVVVEILSSGSVVQTLSAPRSGTTWSVSASALTEGATYSVRARQGDQAGNTSGDSAAISFTVDSIAPAVTLTAPTTNSYLRSTTPTISGAGGTSANDGSITVTIRTTAGVFVQSKTIAASATWTTAPTALGQGTYTVQATQSDAAGNVGASATNTFTVDTVAPTAAGLSAVNGSGTAGWLDSGDAITFSYNEAILPGSVLAGFTGASTPVKVAFTNGGGRDTFTVLDSAAGTTVHLASSVATFANYLQGGDVTFAATMVQSADKKSIVVTLGAPDLPGNLRSQAVSKAQDMTWTLSSGVTDLAGNALVTPGTFAESDNDVDF